MSADLPPCLSRSDDGGAAGMPYYCTLDRGHAGDHGWADPMDGWSTSWPRTDAERASSQAGLASYTTRTAPATRYCPRCRTHPLVRWRDNNDTPHGYCTNAECDYDLET